ncbi:putative toprim domain-containing protein [Bacillus phage vB_BspM_AgentSmith]|nr:putative toprim domain-containing protein [Bacillus phage vB_BspM_AgentSmith]
MSNVIVGKKWDKGAIYIGRGSVLGNPFAMKDMSDETRDEVCDQYEDYFYEQIENDPKFLATVESLILKAEKGKVILGCYCAPKRCHGDTIKDYIDGHLQEIPVNIYMGTNENPNLSNLAPRKFKDKTSKLVFFSVEHAYQSLKSGSLDQETYDKYQEGKSYKIPGTLGTLTNSGWNLKLMESLIMQSFEQNKEAREELLATGTRELTHTQEKGIWKKEFPRILMEVRDKLSLRNMSL